MRLAILALSAAAISGCSWVGGHHAPAQTGCYPAMTQGHGGYAGGYHQTGYSGYSYAQSGPCAGGAYGFSQMGNAYGASQSAGFMGNGYGFQNYGMQAGAPVPGMMGQAYMAQNHMAQTHMAQGATGQMASGYVTSGTPGAVSGQGMTTLNAAAPYGAAIGNQFASAGQFGGAPGVQTIIGAPIYTPQPYPAPYPLPVTGGPACCGVSGGGGYATGGAMRFGAELFAGAEFDASGDIFTKKSDGPPDGDYSIPIRVGEIDPISYKDAFGTATTIGGALSYDHSPSTTVFASVGFSESEGQTVENYTTVQDGTWASQVFTPALGSSPRGLDGEFTDLKTTTVEVGLRQYSGNPHGLRGYLGVSGGFAHNNDVTFTQTYNDTGAYYGQRTFIDSGWNPTAAAVIGAEMPVGPRAAVGVEWGVRWRDNMNTTAPSEDRITVPLALRGRLAF